MKPLSKSLHLTPLCTCFMRLFQRPSGLDHGFRIQVGSFDILKVTVSTYLQFVGSGIVAHNDTLFVSLQGADSPHLHHGTLYSVIKGAGLVVTVNNDQHLFGAQYGTNTYGEGSLGHLVHVVVKEARVGDDGVRSQRLLAGT